MRFDAEDGQLKRALKKRGITGREVARRCGISAAYLSDILNGHRFGGEALRCIARELDLNENDLDWHCYQHGRLSPDLLMLDEGWVRARLSEFRERIMS